MISESDACCKDNEQGDVTESDLLAEACSRRGTQRNNI